MSAEDQLRHLRRLGRLVRLGSWSVSVPHFKVSWSDEVCDIHEVEHGHDPTVEGGLSFYTPEWRERVRAAFLDCVERGEPIDEVIEIVTAKGNRRWVHTIGEAVRDESGAIVEVQGGFQDVTPVKQVESERNLLATRLTESLNSMSDAVIMLNRDWRFTFVNRRAEQLLQRTSLDLVGKNMWDEFPEGRGTVAQAAYERVMTSGGSTSFELDYSPLGVWLEVNVFATDDGLAAYFHDTSERHRTHELLKDALERFRIVTQATADVVWDWNLLTDEIWWSEGMRALFGYDIGTLPSGSSSWTNALHSEDRERVMHGIHAAIDGSDADWQDEYRFVCADGSCAQVIDRGFIIRDAAGKAVRMVGSMVDVTKQRELEAQLRQAQRLDAIGQLTGGVAHDFNNLLTVVLGNAELLEGRLAHEPQLRAIAEMTRMAAERGAELTSRLLAFSRRQPLDPKPTDVGALIAQMGELLRRVLGDHVEIDIATPDLLWPAQIDAPQLENAVLNLCINARDAMPEGGRIDITLANTFVQKGDADGATPGEYVTISVADTGAGMDAQTLARAFEPFFTTKEVGKGSGLGLSMVYGFVTQSKGHVKIHSAPGQGAIVRLYLPRAHGEVANAVAAMPADAPGGDEKVLVVEDNDLVRAQVSAELETLGYTVVSVVNGPEAIAALQAASDFDLLFTDVVLPGGMNGRQLADAARNLRPNLPVLFTSGYAEDVIVHEGQVDAGLHLLRKPYRRGELAASVRSALGSNAR
ncbi:two-component hybrid sensor and regulator [alpha proteobacterium U9-1i]|nr:two-component hybrid sensor and regulator [alpha proteobacterium U9-1i]